MPLPRTRKSKRSTAVSAASPEAAKGEVAAGSAAEGDAGDGSGEEVAEMR
jgi:hypothetical protein